MTKAEQRRFIAELTHNVRAEILAKVDLIPENWDGIELRQYIADQFARCVISGMMDRRRRRAYANTITTTNL